MYIAVSHTNGRPFKNMIGMIMCTSPSGYGPLENHLIVTQPVTITDISPTGMGPLSIHDILICYAKQVV